MYASCMLWAQANAFHTHVNDKTSCVQVTARDATLVATAQPITKDIPDSVAHTAAIHSKSFAKRRCLLSFYWHFANVT